MINGGLIGLTEVGGDVNCGPDPCLSIELSRVEVSLQSIIDGLPVEFGLVFRSTLTQPVPLGPLIIGGLGAVFTDRNLATL